MFDSFENIHKNKKWAFVDGVLCGLVIMKIAGMWKKAYEDYPTSLTQFNETTESTSNS